MPVPRQESEWSSMCVLSVSIVPLSTVWLFDFGTISRVWYFLFFILLSNINKCEPRYREII